MRSTLLVVLSFLLASNAYAAPVVSYFPDRDVGQFLAEKFDLASIRSSLGPRRSSAKRTFADLSIKPSTVTKDAVVFLSEGDWYYELRIVGRRDVNGDGIEDLEVCFYDRALNGGSYDTAEGLLITRYSKNGYALALSYSLGDGKCLEYAK